MSQAVIHEKYRLPAAAAGEESHVSISFGPDSTLSSPAPVATDDVPSEDIPMALDPQQKLWSVYVKEAYKYDDDMVKGWQDDMEGILTFAGLFSAAVTAFILESYQLLQPDNAPQTRLLSDSAVRINVLWSLSLCFSLSCALGATMVKQWARHYSTELRSHTSPRQRARVRAYISEGLRRWKMHEIVDGVPALLHISLFLFLWGLVEYFYRVNPLIAYLLSGFSGIAVLFYIVLTLAPIIGSDSPFQTPLSLLMWGLIPTFARCMIMRRGSCQDSHATAVSNPAFMDAGLKDAGLKDSGLNDAISTLRKNRSSEKHEKLDEDAICWTVKRIDEVNELLPVLEGIPGFTTTALHQTRTRPSTIPHNVSDKQESQKASLHILSQARIGPLITAVLDANPVIGQKISDEMRRRNTICLKAMWSLTTQLSQVYDDVEKHGRYDIWASFFGAQAFDLLLRIAASPREDEDVHRAIMIIQLVYPLVIGNGPFTLINSDSQEIKKLLNAVVTQIENARGERKRVYQMWTEENKVALRDLHQSLWNLWNRMRALCRVKRLRELLQDTPDYLLSNVINQTAAALRSIAALMETLESAHSQNASPKESTSTQDVHVDLQLQDMVASVDSRLTALKGYIDQLVPNLEMVYREQDVFRHLECVVDSFMQTVPEDNLDEAILLILKPIIAALAVTSITEDNQRLIVRVLEKIIPKEGSKKDLQMDPNNALETSLNHVHKFSDTIIDFLVESLGPCLNPRLPMENARSLMQRYLTQKYFVFGAAVGSSQEIVTSVMRFVNPKRSAHWEIVFLLQPHKVVKPLKDVLSALDASAKPNGSTWDKAALDMIAGLYAFNLRDSCFWLQETEASLSTLPRLFEIPVNKVDQLKITLGPVRVSAETLVELLQKASSVIGDGESRSQRAKNSLTIEETFYKNLDYERTLLRQRLEPFQRDLETLFQDKDALTILGSYVKAIENTKRSSFNIPRFQAVLGDLTDMVDMKGGILDNERLLKLLRDITATTGSTPESTKLPPDITDFLLVKLEKWIYGSRNPQCGVILRKYQKVRPNSKIVNNLVDRVP